MLASKDSAEGWLPSNYVEGHTDEEHMPRDDHESAFQRFGSLGDADSTPTVPKHKGRPPSSHPVATASLETQRSMSELLHKLKQVVCESRRDKSEGIKHSLRETKEGSILGKGDSLGAALAEAKKRDSLHEPSVTFSDVVVSPNKPRIILPGPPSKGEPHVTEPTKVIALFDAEPSKPTELAFAKDDVLHIVSGDIATGGWIEGYVDGASSVVGLIPSNRCREVVLPDDAAAIRRPSSSSSSTEVTKPVVASKRSSEPSPATKRRPVPVPRNRKSESAFAAPETPPSSAGSVTSIEPTEPSSRRDRVAPRPATALQDYTANNEGELSLRAGDKVLVLKRHNSRLWHGQIPRGPAGDFPASCVALDVNVPPPTILKENRYPEVQDTCA